MARFACRFSTQLADNGGKRQARSLPSRAGAGDSRRLCDGCGVAPIPCTKREMPSAGMLFSFSGGATPSSDRLRAPKAQRNPVRIPAAEHPPAREAVARRGILAVGEIPGATLPPHNRDAFFVLWRRHSLIRPAPRAKGAAESGSHPRRRASARSRGGGKARDTRRRRDTGCDSAPS